MSLDLDRSTWQRVKLSDLVRNVNEYFVPERDGVLPFVAGPHIDMESAVVSRWGSTDAEDFPPTFKRLFQPGDVLLHSRGVEKVASVDRAGVTGEKLFVLRTLNADILDQRLLVWLLRSPMALRYFEANFSGSVNKFLNWKPLAAFHFDLPPLDQQRRIADLLWASTHELESGKELRDSTASLEKVLLSQIAISSSQTVPLGEIANLKMGRPVPSSLYQETGMWLLKAGDLKIRGQVVMGASSVCIPQDSTNATPDMLLSPGDLIINMTAQSLDDAFLGRTCRVTEPCLLNQRIGLFTFSESVNQDFLFAVLRSPTFTNYVARRAEGSKVKHMHWRHIADFPVPIWSEKGHRLMKDLEAIDEALQNLQGRLQSGKNLHTALLSSALGGSE